MSMIMMLMIMMLMIMMLNNDVNSLEEKLLRVHINSKLSIDYHVSKLCQKASNKLYALAAYPHIWMKTN